MGASFTRKPPLRTHHDCPAGGRRRRRARKGTQHRPSRWSESRAQAAASIARASSPRFRLASSRARLIGGNSRKAFALDWAARQAETSSHRRSPKTLKSAAEIRNRENLREQPRNHRDRSFSGGLAEKERALSSPAPHLKAWAKLLLDLRLARLCRRPITFAETLAASAIAPLEETRSQVVAPAIAANQPVRFRLIADRFPERSCRLGFSRCSFLAERLLTGRLRRVHQILFGRRSGTSDR